MSTPTLSAHPVLGIELFNLLRAGSSRISKLLKQGKDIEARSLWESINVVIDHNRQHAEGKCVCTSLTDKCKAVYRLDEFQEVAGSALTADGPALVATDCGPLCWDEAQQACVEC